MLFLNLFLKFILIWMTVCLVLSLLGWYWLALKYKYKGNFKGADVGIISAEINYVVSYRSCIIMKVNKEGFYVKPLFIFRLFHEPLFIPWEEIKKVEDSRFLFTWYKKLFIGDPFISMIKVSKSTFLRIENALDSQS